MDLIGIGALGAGFSLLLAIPHWQRKRRRREMGLGIVDELHSHGDWQWPPR